LSTHTITKETLSRLKWTKTQYRQEVLSELELQDVTVIADKKQRMTALEVGEIDFHPHI